MVTSYLHIITRAKPRVANARNVVQKPNSLAEQSAASVPWDEDFELSLPGSWPSVESSSLKLKDDMLGAALEWSTYRFSSLGEILGFIFAPPYEEHLSSNVTQALIREAHLRGVREGEAAGAAVTECKMRHILELRDNQLETMKREAKHSIKAATEASTAEQAAKDDEIQSLKARLRRFKKKRDTSKSSAGASPSSTDADISGAEDMKGEAVGGSASVETSESTSANPQSPCDAQPVNETPGVKEEQQASSSTSDSRTSASEAQHSEAGAATSKAQGGPASTTSTDPDVPSRMKSVPEVQPAPPETTKSIPISLPSEKEAAPPPPGLNSTSAPKASSPTSPPNDSHPAPAPPPSDGPIPPVDDLDDALWRIRLKYNPGLAADREVKSADGKVKPIPDITEDPRSDDSAPQPQDSIPPNQEHGSEGQADPASPDDNATSPSAGQDSFDIDMSDSDASTDPSSGEAEDTFMSNTRPSNCAFIPQMPSPFLRGQSARSKRSGRGDYPGNPRTNRILLHHPRLPHYSESKHNFIMQRRAVTKRAKSPRNRKMVCDQPSHDAQQWLLDASHRMDYEYDSDLAWFESLPTMKRSGLGGCRLVSPRSSFR
ncbi:MAG: hypothetical protein Q9208_004595 [Pyrenodesmia sp. 3 TL-2023]